MYLLTCKQDALKLIWIIGWPHWVTTVSSSLQKTSCFDGGSRLPRMSVWGLCRCIGYTPLQQICHNQA